MLHFSHFQNFQHLLPLPFQKKSPSPSPSSKNSSRKIACFSVTCPVRHTHFKVRHQIHRSWEFSIIFHGSSIHFQDMSRPCPSKELLRDSKSIKTESTSRESDEHLQFREVAILRRKNKRLQPLRWVGDDGFTWFHWGVDIYFLYSLHDFWGKVPAIAIAADRWQFMTIDGTHTHRYMYIK